MEVENKDLFVIIPPECVGLWYKDGHLQKNGPFFEKIKTFDVRNTTEWAHELFKLIYKNFGTLNFVSDDVVESAGAIVARQYGEMTLGNFATFVARWINGEYGEKAPTQMQINTALQNYYCHLLVEAKEDEKPKTNDFVYRRFLDIKQNQIGRRLTNHETEIFFGRCHGTNEAEIKNIYRERLKDDVKGKPVNDAYLRTVGGTATKFDWLLLYFAAPGMISEQTQIQLSNELDESDELRAAFSEYYRSLFEFI